jgi:hypothetical protein
MTTPIDTLYPNQWHFSLIGDIETVWSKYIGRGVNIGVYTDGIQFTHTDLDDNYNNALEIVDGGGFTVTPAPNLANNDTLGTAATGISAAELNGAGTVVDLSRIYSAPLRAYSATKEINYGTKAFRGIQT